MLILEWFSMYFVQKYKVFEFWQALTNLYQLHPQPYINTWYKGSTDLQQSQKINFFLIRNPRKVAEWQAWSFYCAFQARIQTKVREGVLSGETQLRSNEGLMWVGGGGVWGSLWDPAESWDPAKTQLNLWIFYGVPGTDPNKFPPENFWKWELRNLLSWPLWDPAESIPTRSRWPFFPQFTLSNSSSP